MALHVEITGDQNAPAIVFLHGGGISGWMWNRQVAAFADYCCLVPDLPEHGKSINEQPMTIADSADRIADLIRNNAAGRKAHIIGHSIGAKIIVEILSRHPEVVDHAVIVSALFRPIPFLKILCNRSAYKSTILMLKSKRLLAYQVKQFGFKCKEDQQHLTDDFRRLTVDRLDHIYGELYKHLELPKNLKNAAAPALIIAGEREPAAMHESVQLLASALPNAKGILLRNCKHDIPWRTADSFNRIIREWLNDKPLIDDEILSIKLPVTLR